MAKYNNKNLINFLEKLREIDNTKVRYGIFGAKASAPAVDGGRTTVGHIARIHEEGREGSRSYTLKSNSTITNYAGLQRTLAAGTRISIPQRPFFTYGHNEIKKSLPDTVTRQFKLLVKNSNSINNMFKQIGTVCKDSIQEEIRNGNFIPISELQIWKKGNNKTLQDSEQLLNSVDYEVIKKG